MHRSNSVRKRRVVTPSGRNVMHFSRRKASEPHCAICRTELHGISSHGGKTRKSNSRIFGGVLCANCTANVIKMRSRIESGEVKLDDIGIKEKAYVLQLSAH